MTDLQRADAPRIRDPQRRRRITDAATDLFARHGYHQVSMADIGRHAGITGSGIYRYFDSKSLILVEVLEGAFDDLDAVLVSTLEHEPDAHRALERLVASQVALAVEHADVARVHYDELRNLPEVDRSRLRRKHRRYIERWAMLLVTVRPELDETEARTLVHAAIGAVHSPRMYSVRLPAVVLSQHLTRAAHAVLGLPPAPPSG